MNRSNYTTDALKVCGATLAALLSLGSVQAQSTAPSLEAFAKSLPGTLINDPTRLDWQVYGPGVGVKSVRDASIPGGNAAIQITLPKKGPNAYETSANIPLTSSVAIGDRVVVSFYARTISAETDDGRGVLTVRLQQNAAPYAGFGDKKIEVNKEWQLYEVPAQATTALTQGVGVAVLQLSGAKQVVQIGQMIVLKGANSILVKSAGTSAKASLPLIPAQLAGKGVMLNDPAARSWSSHGTASPPEALSVGVPGGAATRFVIADQAANIWDASAGVPIKSAIEVGDPLIVAFIARTVSAATPDGKAMVGVRIQQNIAPYDGFADNVIAVGPNWGLYQLRTTAKRALPANGGEVTLQLAGAKQTVEIGPVYVIRPDGTAPLK